MPVDERLSKPASMTGVLVLILLLGCFFRLSGLAERDLWTDEAWVAQAVCRENPAAIFSQGNLEMGNHTPPLYLLLVWGLAQVGGQSEAVLRLGSFLLGMGLVLLVADGSRRLLPPDTALAATAAVAVSTRLVYFSKELKPYAADAFFAMLAVWLTERLVARGGRTGWLIFFMAMAAGLGFSHAMVFPLPVALAVLWWKLPDRRRVCLVTAGGLAIVFAIYYLLFYRGQAQPELVTYWQADFPDLSSGVAFLKWLGAAIARYCRYFFGDALWPLGLGCTVAGWLYALQHIPRLALYSLGPLTLALAAAFAHRYPFMAHAGGVRLMLFSAPLLYITAAAGLMALLPGRSRPRLRLVRLAVAAVVLVWLNPHNVWTENLRPTVNREEIRPLIRYLEAQQHPGDLIYVYYFAIHPFRHYYQGPRGGVIWGRSCHEECLVLPPPRPGEDQRLWVIFSHFEHAEELEKFSRRLLGDGWQPQERLLRPAAALFRFSRPSPPALPPESPP